MTEKELGQIVEAVLFCAPQPLTLQQLGEALDYSEIRNLRRIIAELNKEYEMSGRVFRVQEVARGFQFRTDPQFRPWIQKLEPIKPIKLTPPTIETLAIIAYKQPITRASIEFIRGVDSSYTLKTLLQKKLIKVVGKEAVPGRPILYGTSKKFLEVFGLKDIKNLPNLSELDMDKEDAAGQPIAKTEQLSLLPETEEPNASEKESS